MHALKRFSMVITFAALSLSGSSAWATGENSFVATAELDGLEVVPPKLASTTATVTLPVRSTQPATTGGTIALRQLFNPPRARSRRPENFIDVSVNNIRLYFGQHFANGLPIATLCDNNIPELPKLECIFTSTDEEVETFQAKEEFELRDIQFQEQQVVLPAFPSKIIGGVPIANFIDRRLPNDKRGLKALKFLIKRGLIYVVINSAFTTKLGPDTDNDPETDEIIYTPPAPDPKGGIIIDGDLRGTLRLISGKKR